MDEREDIIGTVARHNRIIQPGCTNDTSVNAPKSKRRSLGRTVFENMTIYMTVDMSNGLSVETCARTGNNA